MVNDIETPSTIARGLNLLFPADVTRTAGRKGRMQGDRTLTIPAPNAATGEIASIAMVFELPYMYLEVSLCVKCLYIFKMILPLSGEGQGQ